MTGDAIVGIANQPELRRLFAAARHRVESRGLSVGGIVRIDDATDEERTAAANLLGWRVIPRSGPLRVRLDALDQALLATREQTSLVAVLTALGGPMEDRPERRQTEAAALTAMWAELRARPLVSQTPHLTLWLDELMQGGLVRRLAGADLDAQRRLVSTALDVIARLPATAERLNVLAASVTGDAHALDPGRPLATVVIRAVAKLADRPVPATAAERRQLWAAVGVACDELSCDVLVHGLRPTGRSLLDRWLSEFASAGEPARITLRQLLRQPVRLDARVVFVSENPVVVAEAADRLGARCPPIVCVDGVPNTAAGVLLDQIRMSGAEIRYRGDRDPPGIRIAELMERRYGVVPWEVAAEPSAIYEEQVLGQLMDAIEAASVGSGD